MIVKNGQKRPINSRINGSVLGTLAISASQGSKHILVVLDSLDRFQMAPGSFCNQIYHSMSTGSQIRAVNVR